MSDLKQILLNAKACSGRGVRVRTLSLSEVAKIQEDAASGLGKEGTMMQLRVQVAKDNVAMMVTGVTESAGFKLPKELVGAKWVKLTPLSFEDGAAAKYFSTPDMDALIKVFKKLHETTDQEVDDILGEAQTVTEG